MYASLRYLFGLLEVVGNGARQQLIEKVVALPFLLLHLSGLGDEVVGVHLREEGKGQVDMSPSVKFREVLVGMISNGFCKSYWQNYIPGVGLCGLSKGFIISSTAR